MRPPRALAPSSVALNGPRGALLSAVVLLAAVFAVYANVLHAPFIFDDYPAVVRNPTIRHLWPPAAVLRPPVDAAGAAGRPLVNVTLASDYALSGYQPFGYHLTNVLLHGLAAALLCLLLRETLARRLGWPAGRANRFALGVSLLWAVHPLVTESVAGVIQRNEILVALATLLALNALARADSGARPKAWLGLGVLAALGGALSKEVAVVIPVLALLYDRGFLAGSFAAAWRARRGFYLGLASTWMVTAALVAMNHARAGTVGFGLGVGAWRYAVTQCRALGTYAGLVIWPHPLVVDYGVPLVHHLASVWPLAVALVAALAVTVYGVVQRAAWGFPAAAFFLLLAPSSSFVPLTTQTIAEHRMYLASAVVILLVALAIARAARSLPASGVIALALALGATTVARNRDYQSEIALWTKTIREVPSNPRAYASLGAAYVRQQRWTEAIACYRDALRRDPAYADAQNDLGYALTQTGDLTAALGAYEQAARLKPDDPDIRYNLGQAYGRVGRDTEAVAQYESALRLRPAFSAAENDLGAELLRLHRTSDAIGHLTAAVRLDRANDAARRNLARALLAAGQVQEAVEQFRAAVELQPESAEAHNDLGLALEQTGATKTALAEFSAAVRLKPDFAGARVNAANVLLHQGDLAGAAAEY
ncbi:MAG TPA: tetratricopeptide repeat protein, partial [Opitutaceae bacterium]|nr:tetratricopeptide repeat protein [Opitutaceae bacterium]